MKISVRAYLFKVDNIYGGKSKLNYVEYVQSVRPQKSNQSWWYSKYSISFKSSRLRMKNFNNEKINYNKIYRRLSNYNMYKISELTQ